MNLKPLTLLLILLLAAACKEPSNTISEQDSKIEALLQTMTLEEKIGQMTQINITNILTDSVRSVYYDTAVSFEIDTNKLIDYVSNWHVGSFLNGRGVTPDVWFRYMDQLQRINMQHSRSGIPIIYGVDHVHGSSYLMGGTIFPHNINIAATFDTSFARESGRITAYETADLRHNWVFSPVLDLGRNKFWGRYYETFGEDPVVASRMGAAYIRGIQATPEAEDVSAAACAKHYIGYSDPKSGWDRSPAEIPDQVLREFFLPPFKVAIAAGVKTIMVNSGEVNGIPVHASRELLTDLLREELGFDGVIVTDWKDILALEKMHFVAENEKEATYMAITAGIDMSMTPHTTDFCVYLKELVTEGRISESRIDASVRRILKLKMDLGLFNHPYPRNDRMNRIGTPESRQQALQAARESLVLIKNENDALPLTAPQRIVLAGPNAHRKAPLCGGWTYRFAAKGEHFFPDDMPTVYDALQTTFDHVVLATEKNLTQEAARADVIVLVLGEEHPYAETGGSIDDLALPDSQVALARQAFATGKPVVLVLTEGRPRIIDRIVDDCSAILFAGLPGIEGAQAITEVISGTVNPSGKMSFTYPYKQGHIIPYNHKHSEYSGLRPVSDALQRYTIAEFGTGLSYTTFAYSDLTLSDTLLQKGQSLTATVTVTNTGDRPGKEAVLWFISDEFASITRPVRALKHFEKQELQPGESRVYTFTIEAERDLSFPDKDGKQLLEPGYFTLTTGNKKRRFKYVTTNGN